MRMVSSVHLAEKIGLPHKQIKRRITGYKIPCVPAGMTQHDGGRLQRMVLVDEEVFMDTLAANAKPTTKKKSKSK